MYSNDADKHQAGLFGLTLEEIPVEETLVWDINWNTFQLFNALTTQWRVGMGGATGLDYSVIPSVGKMLGFKNKQINEMFPDLQVMENEALITMGENQKDANNS
jgi:hypothetical protein